VNDKQTKFGRAIRRVVTRARVDGDTDVKRGAAWQWEDDRGWISYNYLETNLLESSYQSHIPSVTLTFGTTPYIVDVSTTRNFKQTNTKVE
jgi:hypothetical protein